MLNVPSLVSQASPELHKAATYIADRTFEQALVLWRSGVKDPLKMQTLVGSDATERMIDGSGLLSCSEFESIAPISRSVYISDGAGSAWTAQTDRELQSVINAAFAAISLESEIQPKVWQNQLVAYLLAYSQARAGSEIPVSVARAIRLRLPVAIDTPWGRLRPATLNDLQWLATLTIDETVHLDVGFVRNVAIVERFVETRWVVSREPSPAIVIANNPNDIDLMKVQFASMLCAERLVTPIAFAGTILKPFSVGGGGWARPRDIHGSPAEVLDVADLRQTMVRLDERYNEKRHLAISRTLSAASPGRDPVDTVIDCVIAWENILGRGSSEMSFKLSAAASALMAPTGGSRVALFQRFRALYKVRSRVVHGDSVPTLEEAREHASEALLLTGGLLRRSLESDLNPWVMDEDEIQHLILRGSEAV